MYCQFENRYIMTEILPDHIFCHEDRKSVV